MRRIPTVISLNQEQEESSTKPPSGKIGVLCEEGCDLPLVRVRKDICPDSLQVTSAHRNRRRALDAEVPELSSETSSEDSRDKSLTLLDEVLTNRWDDAFSAGLFRYDVTACPSKLVEGRHAYIAQLNVGRAQKKRATEFSVDQVRQAFDDKKFNFTKAGMNEVLFAFEAECTSNGGPLIVDFWSCHVKGAPNLVCINVSPIDYGHVLLLPRVTERLPQQLNSETLLLAMQFCAASANPFFRVGYNTLGAYATINHLHFQAYYLKHAFPVETAQTALVRRRKKTTVGSAVHVFQLVEYPTRGLVFTGPNLKAVAEVVGTLCVELAAANIPHNVLVSDCGSRVFLFPQCYAARQSAGDVAEDLLETQVNPAVWEISGHLVMKREADYENLTEDFIERLLGAVSLSEEAMDDVIDTCFKIDYTSK
mmetsp:Transcript_10172/g.37386  ORF Transcript_10172/g.37386 Transcript_10172/m.37386 type:complete len:423 (-) Transcript_10172:225-1493(-)